MKKVLVTLLATVMLLALLAIGNAESDAIQFNQLACQRYACP